MKCRQFRGLTLRRASSHAKKAATRVAGYLTSHCARARMAAWLPWLRLLRGDSQGRFRTCANVRPCYRRLPLWPRRSMLSSFRRAGVLRRKRGPPWRRRGSFYVVRCQTCGVGGFRRLRRSWSETNRSCVNGDGITRQRTSIVGDAKSTQRLTIYRVAPSRLCDAGCNVRQLSRQPLTSSIQRGVVGHANRRGSVIRSGSARGVVQPTQWKTGQRHTRVLVRR